MMKQNRWRLSGLSLIILATTSSNQAQSLNTNSKAAISVKIAQSGSFESVLSNVRLLDSVSYRIGWTLEAGEFHRLSQEALKHGSVDDFKALLKDENPLVRVMALICLAHSVDTERFAVIAKALFADDARVEYTNGCTLRRGTVGSIAEQLAENRFFLVGDDKRDVR